MDTIKVTINLNTRGPFFKNLAPKGYAIKEIKNLALGYSQVIFEKAVPKKNPAPFIHNAMRVKKISLTAGYKERSLIESYCSIWGCNSERTGYAHTGADWTYGYSYFISAIMPQIVREEIRLFRGNMEIKSGNIPQDFSTHNPKYDYSEWAAWEEITQYASNGESRVFLGKIYSESMNPTGWGRDFLGFWRPKKFPTVII